MRRGGTTVQNVEHTTLLLIKIEEERNLFVNTKIIAIIGRSGSGKSTLAKELAIDLNANIIKSFTTRDLRDEYDDHTQSTHQQYEIDKNNNKAIAIYESKYGHVYWSTTDQVVQNMVNIYVIDYKGLIQLRNFYKEMDILPIYVNTPILECTYRLIKRGDSDWAKRVNIDNKVYDIKNIIFSEIKFKIFNISRFRLYFINLEYQRKLLKKIINKSLIKERVE